MAKDELMSPAEMKPLLTLSKRDPVSAVIGLTKSKDGVVFLAKKVKPRKLVAQMKKKAADASLELDLTTVRFGRATVDTAVDSALVTFTVNKEAAGTLRPKLIAQLKKAGFSKCEIVVDAALENESEEDEAPASAGAAAGAAGAAEAASAAPAGAATGAADAAPASAAAAGAAAGAEAGAASAAASPDGAAAGAAAAANGAAPAAAAAPGADGGHDRAELTHRITEEVKRMMSVLASNPPGADAMKTAALAAQTALKSGDMGAAAQAADTLDRLLAAASQGGAAGAAAGAQAGAHAAAPQVFGKAQAAWVATRAKVQGEFDKLFAEIASVYDGHSVVAELEKSFHAQVQPTMQQLDQSLSAKLAELSANSNSGAHAGLVQQAQQIITQYEQYIAGEKLLSQLDQNPFTPLAAQKTLVASLAVLAKAVH